MYPILWPYTAFALPTYVLGISLSYCLGIILVYKRSKALGLNINHSMNIVLVLLISGFLGARIYHILLEHLDIYIKDPIQIFRIWQGGFVFLGGAILAFINSFYYAKKVKISFLKYADGFAPVIVLCYGLARISCFLAGCCYGSHCELPWAVIFPEGVEAPAHTPIHPTQLYSTFWNLLLSLFLFRQEKKWAHLKGKTFYIAVLLLSLGRLIIEQFRNDYRGLEIITLSQASSISFVLILLCFSKLKRMKDLEPS